MKFNTTMKNRMRTTNHEGAAAYRMTPEMELYTAVVTTTLSNSFYEKGNERLDRIQELCTKIDPKFIAQLAVYTREEMNLRSLPLVLAVELAALHRGDDLVRKVVNRVIRRADEITEILAYYQMRNKRDGMKKLNKLSKQLQYGIADAFNRFDSYQFAKYNRKAEVTLKDALFLCHPVPKDKGQERIFSDIVNGTLETPYTWEVELSAIGQNQYESEADKIRKIRQKWSELVTSKRLGYMAMLRNLRNMIKVGLDPEILEIVCAELADPVAVRNSRQLPFRFLSAYQGISGLNSDMVPLVLTALEKAMKASAENIRGFDLDTRMVIAADVSGSMFRSISEWSSVMFYDIGLLLGMLLQSRSKLVTTGIFGDIWLEKNFPHENILSNVTDLKRIQGQVGYATNGHLVIDALTAQRKVVDKVMIFTDLQMWDAYHFGSGINNSWKRYKEHIAPNARLYLFDLAGYGNTPIRFEKHDVALIAGWSDKVFEILDSIEKGENTLNTIMRTEI